MAGHFALASSLLQSGPARTSIVYSLVPTGAPGSSISTTLITPGTTVVHCPVNRPRCAAAMMGPTFCAWSLLHSGPAATLTLKVDPAAAVPSGDSPVGWSTGAVACAIAASAKAGSWATSGAVA